MSKKIICVLLCIITLVSFCSCTEFLSDYTPDYTLESTQAATSTTATLATSVNWLNVHFIDVGQGDSILLESGGTFVLIDAGEKEYSTKVCDYIRSLGTDTLDYVICTHPHSDHCGGLAQVINEFNCNNFITTESDQQTKTFRNVLIAVEDNNTNYIDAQFSATYSFGDSHFEIMGPYSNEYEEYNNYSVVVKAVCGNTSFLFTGDAETLVEREMLSHNADLKADVLKVSHHGSTTSSSDEFLDAVDPEYAVISCGKNNDYGHPRKKTLNKLSKRNIEIYRTDTHGTIVAHSDKNDITFEFISDKNESKQSSDNANSYSYIGNQNSKKFHLPECDGANKMNEKNKVYFYSRQTAINKGYSPCNSCNP